MRKYFTRGILLFLLSEDSIKAIFQGGLNDNVLFDLGLVLIFLILSVGDDIASDNRIARLEEQIEVKTKHQ